MNEFDFSFKRKPKNKKEIKTAGPFYKFLFSIIIKSFLVIILFLLSLIYIKKSDDNKEKFKNVVYNNSLSFAKFYDMYNKHLGDLIPFKNVINNDKKLVSEEQIFYSDIKREENGYLLTVKNDYSVPALKDGIIIELRKDDKYGNIVKIQNKQGINIIYGYINDLNVKLYDYVEKGEILGIGNGKLFMSAVKDNKYLSYEEFLY